MKKKKKYEKRLDFYYRKTHPTTIIINNGVTICYMSNIDSSLKAKSKLKLRDGDTFDESWAKKVICELTYNRLLQKYKKSLQKTYESYMSITDSELNDVGLRVLELMEQKYPDYYGGKFLNENNFVTEKIL